MLVQGAAGSVGAYAVQLAKEAGAEVTATAFTKDVEYVRGLGADRVIDVSTTRFEDEVKDMDVVIDTVGGETLDRSFAVAQARRRPRVRGDPPDQDKAAQHGVRGVFFYVAVTTACLTADRRRGSNRADSRRLSGRCCRSADARSAHEMLAGKPHRRGKIVLMSGRRVGADDSPGR